MSILRNAKTRFVSYSLGLVVQIIFIFILTSKLDIYQFAVWGISMSFIYIFSTIQQLAYYQNIEKYFPNLNSSLQKKYLIKYIKTISTTSFLVFMIMMGINKFNYFDKYNIENIVYLLLMITIFSTIEAALVILDGYYNSKKNSYIYDIRDLLIYKIPRLLTVLILLNYNFSIFYLLFVSMILRIIFLLFLLKIEWNNLYEFILLFRGERIFQDNFSNFKYNFFAFSNSTIYLTFLNLLFLVASTKYSNLDIAHYSLLVLIINNLRPVFNSLPTVITPMISKLIKERKKTSQIIESTIFINQLCISFLIIIAILEIENKFILDNLLADYFSGIYILITLAIFSSSLSSNYTTQYIFLLFNKKEKNIFLFNISISIFLTLLYFYLAKIFLDNFIYIYILYEFLFYCFINYNYFIFEKKNIIFRSLSYSYFLSLLTSVAYLFNFFSYWLIGFYFIVCIAEINRSRSYYDSIKKL